MRGIYAGIGGVLCALCASSDAAVSEPTILSDVSLDAVTAGQDLPEPLSSSYDVLAERGMDPAGSDLATIPGSGSGIGAGRSLFGPLAPGGSFGPNVGGAFRPPIGGGLFGEPDDFSSSTDSSSSTTP